MPFMVIYSTSDGTSCHEQADAIDEAARFVERLRNQDGIEDVRMYRMEEISFAFRPYYKVELGMPELQATSQLPEVADGAPAPPAPDVASTPPPAHAANALVSASAPIAGASDGDANARKGLFGR